MFKVPVSAVLSYLDRRQADLETLRRALAENAVEPFHTIGHKIIGNARSFGFDPLEKIGEKCQSLTIQSLGVDGSRLVAEFDMFIQQARANIVKSEGKNALSTG